MLRPILKTGLLLATRVFFRHIEQRGTDRVPDTGPVLLVSNHLNSFVDPLVLQLVLQRPLTLTAKNTLLRHPLYGPLMRIGGVIPFHREMDRGQGARLRANTGAMESCQALLRQGGCLSVFPEGISHSDPSMRAFKSGAAAIALDVVDAAGGPHHLTLLPAGLVYRAKERFRTDVLVRFGEPLDLAAWRREHPDHGRRELTREIETRVRRLVLDYQRPRDRLLFSWAADLLPRDGAEGASRSWGGTVDSIERLMTRAAACRENASEETKRAEARVQAFGRELDRRGIEVADLVSPGGPESFGRRVGRCFAFLLGAPVTFWGLANHLLPALVTRQLTRMMATGGDLWASSAVYLSVLLFPLAYGLQTALVWWLAGGRLALIYTLLLPITGIVALLDGEHWLEAWRRYRARRLLRRDPDLCRRLRTEATALRRLLSGAEPCRGDM